MTTHSQRALILYRRRRFINQLLTYLLYLQICVSDCHEICHERCENKCNGQDTTAGSRMSIGRLAYGIQTTTELYCAPPPAHPYLPSLQHVEDDRLFDKTFVVFLFATTGLITYLLKGGVVANVLVTVCFCFRNVVFRSNSSSKLFVLRLEDITVSEL